MHLLYITGKQITCFLFALDKLSSVTLKLDRNNMIKVILRAAGDLDLVKKVHLNCAKTGTRNLAHNNNLLKSMNKSHLAVKTRKKLGC